MNRKYLISTAVLAFLICGVAGNGAWAVARRVSAARALAPRQAAASRAQAATPEKVPPVEGSQSESLVVSGITISAGPNGETFVDIATTKAGSFHVSEVKNPRRLVVDFEGARKGIRRDMFSADSSLMTGVRVGQFQLHPAMVRVVADLLGNPKIEVHPRSGGVRIKLSPRGAEAAEVSPAMIPEGEKTEALARLPLVRSSEATLPVVGAIHELPLQLLPPPSAAETTLPGPETITHAPASLKAAPVLDPESMRSERAAQVLSASLTPEGQGQAGEAAATPEQPKYTGELISVNLKDVDLKDFFRLVHEISGLNIIIDPNVTGSVTMVLDSVPWDQALDLVMKNNDLGKVLEGNVLRIAKVETLTAEQAAAAKLVEARIDAQPLVTKFIPVNYAKGATIATLLKGWVGGGALSKRGTVLVDERTNTLIVSDIAAQIPVITAVIAKLDTKSKQVSIEARVVLATNNFERDISSVLAIQGKNSSGSTTAAGATAQPPSSAVANVPPIIPGPTTFGNGLITPSNASGFGIFSILNVGSNYIINAALAAAEATDQAKIVSSPYIVTQNNTAGRVVQGVQIPYQTTVNNTVSVQFIQASLQLTVTPQVTSDGNVFLDITVNNASPGALIIGVGTSINNQLATTQVLVPDGGTVIFGGVKVTNSESAATYVPGLGKIPVLGRLFKTTKATDNKTDLMFFVTPKVLPG
ncbi:MAG: hypothetical protein DMG21_06410 [Acidobacteria bacterium]|nr:MAG: hypothetical protein DMG21_06410 [Acidobacteriota bacterium]